ncbi:hypothetical protein N7456_013187 [Penicillium angulare]|uniref:Ribosomal protein S36, mitochondrial n=1 Tax=Penicillium angulare TaxID=116970 RepID=A0A9W9JW87_9EURO|nr:hypothetical protein N7456_013187 [Penicillium angulare]
MRATMSLFRSPSIRFLGKRSAPKSVDHSPRVHPASPETSLPDSFASYRAKAQQHGPLGRAQFTSGGLGGRAGASLGPVRPNEGQFFDRAELPTRFGRLPWSQAEIEAIETGGASMYA